jgi:hypothetical protein
MQARWLAESGIDLVRSILSDPTNLEPGVLDFEDNRARFCAQPVEGLTNNSTGRVSIVSPQEDGTNLSIRFGLVDESAKIPLHRRMDKRDRTALMGLPNMTEEIADAILDWVDPDGEARELGAESTYYAALSPPYEPRNAAPQTIGELLLVRGVTPALLFGEDVNLDGILNPNENDGAQSWPPDDNDGVLDRGWYPYLTLHSASANVSSTGEPRINLNDKDDAVVQAALTELFSEELATFVAAYKKEKKKIKSISELIDAKVEVEAPGGGGDGGGGNPLTGRGGGGRGGRGGGKQKITLESPWTSENVSEYLTIAFDQLSTSDKKNLKGRIDVLRAPPPVLQFLPGITADLAQQIYAAASQQNDLTPAWLLTSGVLTVEQFREIEPELASSSRVFRFESVGYLENTGPVVRIEAIIDVKSGIPKVVQRQNLTALGNGYSLPMLMGSSMGSSMTASGW